MGGGDLTLRQSCFKCHFTSPERVGDITLADFWQYRARTYSSKGSEKGVSLVLINTELGKRYFESVGDKIKKEEHTWKEALISTNYFLLGNRYSCALFQAIRSILYFPFLSGFQYFSNTFVNPPL